MISLSLPKLRWGELIGSALILAFLIYDQSTKRDLLAGWNRLWLLAGLVAAGNDSPAVLAAPVEDGSNVVSVDFTRKK